MFCAQLCAQQHCCCIVCTELFVYSLLVSAGVDVFVAGYALPEYFLGLLREETHATLPLCCEKCHTFICS